VRALVIALIACGQPPAPRLSNQEYVLPLAPSSTAVNDAAATERAAQTFVLVVSPADGSSDKSYVEPLQALYTSQYHLKRDRATMRAELIRLLKTLHDKLVVEHPAYANAIEPLLHNLEADAG